MAQSYAAVDDPNIGTLDLSAQCKDRGAVDFSSELVVQLSPDGTDPLDPSTSTVSAESAQAQCSSSTAICVVPPNLRLVMSSSLNVPALIVRGELYWRDTDQGSAEQWLCGGYIAVEDGGKFIMNLQDPTKRAWVYIKDNGATHPIGRKRFFGSAVPHPFPSGLAATPIVEISGREMVRTWSLLSAPLLEGENTIQLFHSPLRMGWKIGDRIGISSMASASGGSGQTFSIVDANDDGMVVLDGSSNQDYSVESHPPTKAGVVNPNDPFAPALLSAEVANLSRNVIITGDDFRHVPCDPGLPEAVLGEQTSTQGCRCSSFRSKCTLGLHTAQMGGGTMSIRNARVEKCGQRGVEGKYCLHFHKLGPCPDCVFANNAIEFGHQRGIIVHGTHLSSVEANVLWDVRGAGIYIEDGNEMFNTIQYNVLVCPWPFRDGLMNGCTVPGTSNSQADTANNQSGIYTETAANDLIGNRVANAFNGMFLQANGQGRGAVYGKVCTNHLEYGRWEGNTFHGHLRFGTYTLGGSEPRQTDQSVSNNGYNSDREVSCAAIDSSGRDRGAPVSILNNVDYGNVFVGHYTAGDIQHRGHKSISNNNLMYWKETKNFADGCASHITDAYYERGTMALPDQSTFIIQDTTFGEGTILEANHHCNVGTTGFLCMPQYIFDNVRWTNTGNGMWTWLQRGGTGGGGIFSLSPPDALAVMEATPQNQAMMEDLLFPPGFVSVASSHYTYLLASPGGICVAAASLGPIFASRYDNGILCRVPLRAFRIYTRNLEAATAPSLLIEAWFDSNGISSQSINQPTASQTVEFHSTGNSSGGMKQGFSVPVIPIIDGAVVSYRLSLSTGGSIPQDWIVAFSDPVMGNRYGAEYVSITVQGRDCGIDGVVSSQHDRRFLTGLVVDEIAWGNHGACIGPDQPPDMEAISCSAQNSGKIGAISLTECPELCTNDCNEGSYCHCGKATCECKAGFAGESCSVDLCAAARCGDHGTCASLYLGGSLPVTSSKQACVCDEGWFGPLCDRPDPCVESGRSCNGNGRCVSLGLDTMCECNDGYSGENCETSCDGICRGDFPYGCAWWDMEGVVKYKCGPSGGCQYLPEGEEGPSSWCTFKDISGVADACTCFDDSECLIPEKCEPDGSCPTPTSVANGTPCNSKPMGICQDSACVEPLTSNPTSMPTSVSPTLAPTIIPTSPPMSPTVSPSAGPTQAPSGRPTNTPTASPPSPCDCQSCTSSVQDALACDGGGCYSCQSRIDWLQSSAGGSLSELAACSTVGSEFPSECGGCNPESCDSTAPPTTGPSFRPTSAPTMSPTVSPSAGPTQAPSGRPTNTPTASPPSPCDCQSCTSSVQDALACDGGGCYSCQSRIDWLQSSAGGSLSELAACSTVGSEFPSECGGCNPESCDSTA